MVGDERQSRSTRNKQAIYKDITRKATKTVSKTGISEPVSSITTTSANSKLSNTIRTSTTSNSTSTSITTAKSNRSTGRLSSSSAFVNSSTRVSNNSISGRSSLVNKIQLAKTPSPLTEKFNKIDEKLDLVEGWYKELKEDNQSIQNVLALLTELYSKFDESEECYNQLRSENTDLKATVANLKSEISGLNNQLQQLKDTQIVVEKGIVNNQQEFTNELKLEVAELNRQVQQLTETQSLAEKGITLDQQVVNSNIVIRGVDFTENPTESDLVNLYNNIRSHLGIAAVDEFSPVSAKILQPKRLDTKTKEKTAKIVQIQLSTVAAKRQFLQIRRAKKDIAPADIGLVQKSKLPILITEQLTKANQELLFLARSLRGTHRYKYVWSCNGQILARFKQNYKVIRITDIEHVNQLRAEIELQPLARNGRLQSRSFVEPGSNNTQA